jgi:hypothetical protein
MHGDSRRKESLLFYPLGLSENRNSLGGRLNDALGDTFCPLSEFLPMLVFLKSLFKFAKGPR